MPGAVVGSSGPAGTMVASSYLGPNQVVQMMYRPNATMVVGAVGVDFFDDPPADEITIGIVAGVANGPPTFLCSGTIADPTAGHNIVTMDVPVTLADDTSYGITVLPASHLALVASAAVRVGGYDPGNNGVRFGNTPNLSSAIGGVSFPYTLYAPEPVAVPAISDDVADTAGRTPVTVDVLDNDDLGVEPTTVTAVTQAAHGTVTHTDTTVTYTADVGFDGEDTFTYTITDDNAATSTGTVTVTVTPAEDGGNGEALDADGRYYSTAPISETPDGGGMYAANPIREAPATGGGTYIDSPIRDDPA